MQPTPPNDDRVMSLVQTALCRPPTERLDYLADVCGDDMELLRLVREYLAWEEQMNGFLLDPVYRSTEVEPAFEAGLLLEGRFRIVRQVAQGGMGIVYEAVDERLDRRIALKCAKAGFAKRLSPEVRHASTISHPNVCKIFEIHTAATAQGSVDFVTMEFLDGETLAERLKRGRPGRQDARRFALQICAGLAEAHRRKVIHGDLKSSNIILTEEPGGGTRAVITDFGLARLPGDTLRAAQSGPLMGTPTYMAPELWKGAKPSIASDIYALGVILSELGTDKTAGAGWDRTVQRCREQEPGKRFADATAVAQALSPRSRPWIAGVAAALLAAISGLVTYRVASVPEEHVQLAVLPFESTTDTAPLARQISTETSTAILHLRPSHHTVISVSRPDRASSATHILRTAISRVPDTGAYSVQVWLRDARTQTDRVRWKAVCQPAEVRHLPTVLAGIVASSFHVPPLVATATVSAAANQDYLQGISLLRRNSTLDAAIPLLERAVAADPDSPLTHAALAEGRFWKYLFTKTATWRALAVESLRNAERRNPDLAEVHRASGWMLADSGDYAEAEAHYLRAIELNPRDGDAWRRLGNLCEKNRREEEALAAYRRAVEADVTSYRSHQALGHYFVARGQYEEAIVHFKRAVEAAPDEAASHFALGRGYVGAGRFLEAESELRESLLHGETADALNTLGAVLMYLRNDAEAITLFQRALQLYGENHLWRMNLGTANRRLGLRTEDERAYKRAVQLVEVELGKNPRSGYLHACLAYSSAWLGDRNRATFEVVQALELTPHDSETRRMAVKVWEALGRRDDSLEVLKGSAPDVAADLARYPDLADLHKDLRFQEYFRK